MSFPTAFTLLFALACLVTFVGSFRKEWKEVRRISAVVAVLSFMLALYSASLTK